MTNHLNFDFLKEKQRAIRAEFSENLGLRIHRAISWLERAEKEKDDPDAAFIFYWIAFNAAYTEDRDDQQFYNERQAYANFFNKLVENDHEQAIHKALWTEFEQSIRLLLDNQYVFSPFWKYHNGVKGFEDWERRFEKSRVAASHAIHEKNSTLLLSIVFDRLYMLRNQLVHGGATWNSSVNRWQVEDGAKILSILTPIFLNIMMDNSDTSWGAPYFPVV